MTIRRTIAATVLVALMATLGPIPTQADGAASTRNIFFGLGAAAATYLVIQHNRKVHERYAEDARRQAALQSENSNAWGAYQSEQRAYQNSQAEVADLKREVAYQHGVITEERHQLARSQSHGFAQQSRAVASSSRSSSTRQPTMIAYGWGQI